MAWVRESTTSPSDPRDTAVPAMVTAGAPDDTTWLPNIALEGLIVAVMPPSTIGVTPAGMVEGGTEIVRPPTTAFGRDKG